jgi:hypothetical protein
MQMQINLIQFIHSLQYNLIQKINGKTTNFQRFIWQNHFKMNRR